jgi:hypothetical protein
MTSEEARALILSFPEVTEDRERRDGPIFRVRRRFFTRSVEHDESLLVSRVPYEERELLAELDPDTYRLDPHRMVLIVRIALVLPESLRRLLEFCWRNGATLRAVRAYDAARTGAGTGP